MLTPSLSGVRSTLSLTTLNLLLPPPAELFVSAVNPFPGYLNFTWASTTTNADERIWIPTSDPFYPGWTPFTFYIGVLGYNGNAT